MREYSSEEVSKHKTKETGIWMTYRDRVYNVTEFVEKHPGGDKILLAAGGPVEPYWSLYAVHKDNKEVMEILKQYEIGVLIGNQQDRVTRVRVRETGITGIIGQRAEDANDPYNSDPQRHPALNVVCSKPFNAEIPTELLTDGFITPNPLFFVRNHLPVPVVDIE